MRVAAAAAAPDQSQLFRFELTQRSVPAGLLIPRRSSAHSLRAAAWIIEELDVIDKSLLFAPFDAAV